MIRNTIIKIQLNRLFQRHYLHIHQVFVLFLTLAIFSKAFKYLILQKKKTNIYKAIKNEN